MSAREDPVETVWEDVGEAMIIPQKWMVPGLIPVGCTFLTGAPKSYKSTVLMAAALSAMGVQHSILPPNLCGDFEEDGLVMGLSYEAQAGVLRHTAKVGAGVEIPTGQLLVVADPFRFRLDSRDDNAELVEWWDRLKPRMAFVDPLRNAHSLDENDSGGMVGMIQPLQQYAVKNDMALVVLHHTKKLDDEKGNTRNARASDMRGSSALFGLADAVITHTKKGPGLVHLDAVFKRAEPWEVQIQLGIWGATPVESIDSFTKQVFTALAAGQTPEAIAKETHMSKMKIQLAIQQLKRMGALNAEGAPVDGASSLVETATRRYGGSK